MGSTEDLTEALFILGVDGLRIKASSILAR